MLLCLRTLILHIMMYKIYRKTQEVASRQMIAPTWSSYTHQSLSSSQCVAMELMGLHSGFTYPAMEDLRVLPTHHWLWRRRPPRQLQMHLMRRRLIRDLETKGSPSATNWPNGSKNTSRSSRIFLSSPMKRCLETARVGLAPFLRYSLKIRIMPTLGDREGKVSWELLEVGTENRADLHRN
jgi:hypothetical protein